MESARRTRDFGIREGSGSKLRERLSRCSPMQESCKSRPREGAVESRARYDDLIFGDGSFDLPFKAACGTLLMMGLLAGYGRPAPRDNVRDNIVLVVDGGPLPAALRGHPVTLEEVDATHVR